MKCHSELLSYWGDKILYDFITDWPHLTPILSLQISCTDKIWCNDLFETYLVVQDRQCITFSFSSSKPDLWIIFKYDDSGLRYVMCCWVSGWLSIFQKNECLHLQGEEAKPILWYVRIHSPNNRASHPAVPKCSEAQIFQIHFLKML